MKKAIGVSIIIVICYMAMWSLIAFLLEIKIPICVVIGYTAIILFSTLAGYFVGYKLEKQEAVKPILINSVLLALVTMMCYIILWLFVAWVVKWQISLHDIIGLTAMIIVGFIVGDGIRSIENTKKDGNEDDDELK